MRVCAYQPIDRYVMGGAGQGADGCLEAPRRPSPPATLARPRPGRHARGSLRVHTPPGGSPARLPDAPRTRAHSTPTPSPYRGVRGPALGLGRRERGGGGGRVVAPLVRGPARLPPPRAAPPPAPRTPRAPHHPRSPQLSWPPRAPRHAPTRHRCRPTPPRPLARTAPVAARRPPRGPCPHTFHSPPIESVYAYARMNARRHGCAHACAYACI